jgi:hypothetical protein
MYAAVYAKWASRSRVVHKVLWDNLTVKEHLHIFGALKGIAEEDLEDEVQAVIKRVMLSLLGLSTAYVREGAFQIKVVDCATYRLLTVQHAGC